MAKSLAYFAILFCPAVLLSSSSNPDFNFLTGKFEPKEHTEFIQVPQSNGTRAGLYLQKQTLDAFLKMANAAKKEHVSLYVLSATRNFNQQKSIWEAKYLGKRRVGGELLPEAYPDGRSRALVILKYSSMPGTSRHHWGTDLDISYLHENVGPMLSNSAWEQGEGLKAYYWMRKNAYKYGFCQPYQGTPRERSNGSYEHGYLEEKWHWSYYPLARKLTEQYSKYKDSMQPSGFAGSEFGIEFYLQYVLNVAAECK
ncbi:MAG: M15 family metallopeptidase [Leptospirales bacterium]